MKFGHFSEDSELPSCLHPRRPRCLGWRDPWRSCSHWLYVCCITRDHTHHVCTIAAYNTNCVAHDTNVLDVEYGRTIRRIVVSNCHEAFLYEHLRSDAAHSVTTAFVAAARFEEQRWCIFISIGTQKTRVSCSGLEWKLQPKNRSVAGHNTGTCGHAGHRYVHRVGDLKRLTALSHAAKS